MTTTTKHPARPGRATSPARSVLAFPAVPPRSPAPVPAPRVGRVTCLKVTIGFALAMLSVGIALAVMTADPAMTWDLAAIGWTGYFVLCVGSALAVLDIWKRNGRGQ